MLIGERIKEIRKLQKMSLSELSQKSGVQIATLSRIEHLKMTGTLESHMKIAQALGVDITLLYSNIAADKDKPEIKTNRSDADMFVHSDKSAYEILATKVLMKKMMPVLLKIEPEGHTNKEQNIRGSEKFIFVLEGKIEVKVGSDTYTLSKNNSLYFDSAQEHYFINRTKSQAKAICVTTPVNL
jgi:transcriptional regulator with XRE-family HTH domain